MFAAALSYTIRSDARIYVPTWQNTEVFSGRNNTYSWDILIENKSPTKVHEVFSCFPNGKYFRNENKRFF